MTVAKKVLFFSCVLLLKLQIVAAQLENDGLLRDVSGRVIFMTQPQALEGCKKTGMRLPTIRELAKLYLPHGLKIKEPKEVTHSEVESGKMRSLSAVNPDGKEDRFYYGNRQYDNPPGVLGSEWFWSSSEFPYSDLSFSLGGQYGDIVQVRKDLRYSARCVPLEK